LAKNNFAKEKNTGCLKGRLGLLVVELARIRTSNLWKTPLKTNVSNPIPTFERSRKKINSTSDPRTIGRWRRSKRGLAYPRFSFSSFFFLFVGQLVFSSIATRRQSWCFFFFFGEISHRGDRKKKSSAKITKDFFGKRTPESPYFEEKKSLNSPHF
jgi:hypothetical protein